MTYRFQRRATLALFVVAAFDAAAAPCPATSLTPATALPAATVGVSYNQSFGAMNANGPPFAFAIAGGLPSGSGLSFKATGASSASLIGSPTQAGTYAVTVTTTDATGCSGGRTYTLTIAPAR